MHALFGVYSDTDTVNMSGDVELRLRTVLTFQTALPALLSQHLTIFQQVLPLELGLVEWSYIPHEVIHEPIRAQEASADQPIRGREARHCWPIVAQSS